ncbi:smoothelin, like [Fundulus heteroclitus]|uniref:smoothelin, like n=1 Tax=Fundulus heteroclitus TaxID=8078 RepID=UPI00165A7482|nr:smoothelin, like [Fundulus heteroclitus]
MEAPTLALMEDLCHPRSPSPEGETVCAALARYENTLRDTIREIHAEVSTFKLDIERRCDETANLSGPLGRAVLQLQQENQQLRNQLEALTRQVELLNGLTCEREAVSNNHSQNHKNELHDIQEDRQDVKEVIYGKGQDSTQSRAHHHIQNFTLENQPQPYNSQSSPSSTTASLPCSLTSSSSPPAASRGSSMILSPGTSGSPSITRFSSRATFAVSTKTNSIEREEPIEVDPVPIHTGQENGHDAAAEHSALAQGKASPPTDGPLQHAAPVTLRMPHLPITATTKTAEIKASAISPSSPVGSVSPPRSQASPSNQSVPTTSRPLAAEDSALQPASVAKTWTPTTARTLGSPNLHEKANSAPAKSVTYSGLLQHRRDDDISNDRASGQAGERKRELVRSQTLPRNIGAQARRSIFERLDSDAGNNRPKPAGLKRSQSFGVSTASSIKQILLEWCRSKTIGYQNIDIQNFSSSWSDGMAFCALVHSFFPTEFDYNALSPANRKHNFELAFGTAEAKASCDRLIEVEDMMIMGRKPDPMCVFTYVQSLYNHLRKFE